MQSILTIIPAIWRFSVLFRMSQYCAILVLALLISGCLSTQGQSNQYAGNGWYTVKPTDTLYSIAWRYGLDYQELANWNQISDDYIINLGQRLIMYNPGQQTVAEAPASNTSGESSGSSTTNQSTATPAVKTPTTVNPPAQWLWPAEGKLLSTFSIKRLDRRGIDIGGKLGQAVRATASGKVVYSGNGLVGYGNLIIIKHNETYLSAYAYSKERLVSEGAVVKAGVIIARMGQHNNESARLHFQIRKNGKPVDPMKYLPNK